MTALSMTRQLLDSVARDASPPLPQVAAGAAYARLIHSVGNERPSDGALTPEARNGRALNRDQFLSAITPREGQRDDTQRDYLVSLKRNIINGPSYASFTAFITEFAHHLRPTFPNIFGRRITIRSIARVDVGSEETMMQGHAAINATLGGAWMLKYVARYMLGHQLRDESFARSVTVAPASDEDQAKLWNGFLDSSANQGFAAFFNERPFHPRVLWEVLSGNNERYPAESLLVQECLRHFARETCPTLQVFWSYDLVPLVADLRKDDGPEVESAARIGQVAVQDYAAYGRTNHSNRFLQVPAFADLQVREFLAEEWPNPWLSTDGPQSKLLREFFWPHENQNTGQWAVYVLNARTSAIYASESLRKQILINHFLNPGSVRCRSATLRTPQRALVQPVAGFDGGE